jgi:hypothetical protein
VNVPRSLRRVLVFNSCATRPTVQISLQQAQESIKRAQDVVNTTLVTGPTDCKAATDHPDTYAAPAPEFIRDNSARVKIARQHAMDLVRKAKTHSPLYQGNKLPGNQGILGHGSG